MSPSTRPPIRPFVRHVAEAMPFRTPRFRSCSRVAGVSALTGPIALTAIGNVANAAILSGQRLMETLTSVSLAAGTFRTEVVDGAPFDEAFESTGVDAQGAVSSASVSQSSVFDSRVGSLGSSDTRIATGTGVSGRTIATLVANFDLGTRSIYTVRGRFETQGNAEALGVVQLFRRLGNGDFLDLFVFELEATTTFEAAGVMEPGTYGFFFRNGLDADGTGRSGSARFQYDLRFSEDPGGNAVPEPTSLALALLAGAVGARAGGRRWRVYVARASAARSGSLNA